MSETTGVGARQYRSAAETTTDAVDRAFTGLFGRAPTFLDRPATAPARALGSRVAQRGFDIVFASVALLVTAPVMLAILLVVKASSPGPVLFRHQRMGRGHRPFTCLKFRTMVVGAEDILQRMLDDDPERRAEFEAEFKLHDDPRVTRIGRWLRRTSLDELPQFWNVLRGEMSVVGPRPVVEDELEKYGTWQSLVLSVRPGITGLWQVSGRNDVDYDERVAMDVGYVRTRSFLTDLGIVLRTVRSMVMVRSNGAY